MIVTSGELYRDQMATLRRMSAFVGQELSFQSDKEAKEVEEGIFRNSKSKGDVGHSTQQLLYVFLQPPTGILADSAVRKEVLECTLFVHCHPFLHASASGHCCRASFRHG